MCLYPKLILNRKYTATKKNGGNVPEMKDPRTKYVPIGCGVCMECRKQKANQWRVRLQEELRTNNTGKFVTMTFTDDSLIKIEKKIHEKNKRLFEKSAETGKRIKYVEISGYELDNEIATYAIRKFLERWRKDNKRSVKHWVVTELGQNNTERLHIHGIIFTTRTLDYIREKWKYGNVNKRDKDWRDNYCTERTVNYIVKYINKTDVIHKYYKPIVLTSPGIGKNYLNRYDSKLNKFKGKDTNEAYTTRQGAKLNMPIYYRNKLYTEEQREELWLNMLNKEQRYVWGVKIDVSKNDDDYWNVVQHYRRLNDTLGFGNNRKDHDRIKYENQRRIIKNLTRIRKNEPCQATENQEARQAEQNRGETPHTRPPKPGEGMP